MEKKVTSAEETMGFAQQLAKPLQAGAVIGLVGNLGAGKTHFVKGLAQGLGSDSPVSSPTFTLVHEYSDGVCPLYHFDFYRMDQAQEIENIGWDEYLDEAGIVVVEWADRFPELMPPHTQWWQISIGDGDARTLQLLNQAPQATANHE
ncbi:MAG: tRNA (adenosine(37)-N6)-threonylcarbamoyltransferase complex ATPase subunit type 1 TsaE [Verrucomicrobiota bacterium]